MHRMPPLAVALVALTVAVPAHARTRNHDQTWSRSWEIADRPSIQVIASDAAVTVHGRDGGPVEVRVHAVGRTSGYFVGDMEPEVTLRREGSRVFVGAKVQGSVSGIVTSNLRLTVEVWTPRGSDVTVSSHDGDVVAGPLDGRIELHTRDGDIRAAQLAGDLQLSSTDGRIEAQGLAGRLVLVARDGRARVHGRFDALSMRSNDASLEVAVARGSTLQEGWSVQARDGSIDLRLPPGFRATLDAASADGSLDISLPLALQGRPERHAIRGDLNGGGGLVTLRSHDGSIRVSALD